MPHDANGELINVSDIVYIPAKVKAVHMSEEFCNLDLEFMYIMPGRSERDTFSAINTRQVVKKKE
jgi:hypothetical protein